MSESHFNIMEYGIPGDTIAAVSSPKGVGAIAVLRISGPDSFSIINKIFKPSTSDPSQPILPRTMTMGTIVDPASGRFLDQSLIALFPAPNTYTGENIVEIFCHGGLLVTREILSTLLRNGSRAALPGEFTRRAVINRKIDLAQAESVLDIINARNRSFLNAAVRKLEGSLSARIMIIRKSLVDLLAAIEVLIEYPEEDTPQLPPEQIETIISGSIIELKKLLSNSDSLRLANEGYKIAVVGKPNAGKSSLVNSILGKNRVIVSDTPGTTRDLVGDWFALGGVDMLIMDTAGITITHDNIEKEGISRTLEYAKTADIVIALFDSSSIWSPDDDKVISFAVTLRNAIPVLSKCDLPMNLDIEQIKNLWQTKTLIKTSSKTIDGMKSLENYIEQYVDSEQIDEFHDFNLNLRCINSLKGSLSHLSCCLSNIGSVSDDILTIDIHNAIDNLSEVTGESTSQDVFDSIFNNFCVGK